MNLLKKSITRSGWLIWITFCSFQAQAVNGVFEINQACALEGCFNGDSAGFPVTISSQGSYQLSSHLQVADLNKSALEVEASAGNVKIDLAGFSLAGSATCQVNGSGIVTSCNSGTGIGIEINDGVDSVFISNGNIRNFPTAGLDSNAPVILERLSVNECGAGIGVHGESSVIQNIQVKEVSGFGISLGELSIVERIIVESAGGDGFSSGGKSILSHISLRNVGGRGIETFGGSLVEHSVADFSGSLGVPGAGDYGFSANPETLLSNIFSGNSAGTGLNGGVVGHSIFINNGSAWNGDIQIEPNVCDSSMTCP